MPDPIIKIDTNDEFSWDQITIYRNDNGTLAFKSILFDNGIQREDEFDNGILQTSFQTDQSVDGLAKNWETYHSYYNSSGEIAFREVIFDTGLKSELTFANGVRAHLVLTDLADAKSFETQNIYYTSTGLMTFRETLFDDGDLRQEEFQNGIRSHTIETNANPIGNAWASRESYYDTTGQIVFKETLSANGTLRQDEFDAGQLVHTTQREVAGAEDANNWSLIDTYYDAQKQIAFRSTTFDNGVEKIEEFNAGQRTVTRQIDHDTGSGITWDEITTYFDANGQREMHEVLFDGGGSKVDNYSNGVLFQSVETDGAEGTAGDLKDWTRVESIFDALGKRLFRDTEYDDGRSKTESYSDGLIFQSVVRDVANLYDWDRIDTNFNFGVRDSTGITYDNGDQLLSIYENNARTARIEHDVDGDRPWLLRLTEYSDSGDAPVVSTYDTYEDLPDPYADYFLIGA